MAQATIATTVTGIQGHPVSNSAPSTGQALVFNGTQWAPDNSTYLPTAGGTLTGSLTLTGTGVTLTAPAAQINGALGVTGAVTLSGNLASTGNITTSGNISTTGSGAVQTPGNPGNLLNGAGTNLVSGRAFVFRSSTTAYSVPDGNYRAFGLNCTLTPATSGRLILSARIGNMSSGSNSTFVVLSYGTGTPPTQGAAISSSSQLGNGVQGGYGGSSWANSGSLSGMLNGMTIGTTYWFDFACVGPMSFQYPNLWIAEV